MTATALSTTDPRTTELPGTGVVSITPSDSTVITPIPRALHIGGGGTLAVVCLDGTTATFTVATGTLLPIRVTKVMSTNTTASLIVGIL